MNRETWLLQAVEIIRGWFTEKGYILPEVIHISVGFPSKSALSRKKKRLGECWSKKVSNDGAPHIFITPLIADGVKALDVVVHELIHAALGAEVGHKKPFADAAKKLGLEGPATATHAGDALVAQIQGVIDRLGPYPHAALNPALLDEKKQPTRLIKVVCDTPSCREDADDDKKNPVVYTARITRLWLDKFGAPLCPNCEQQMKEANASQE